MLKNVIITLLILALGYTLLSILLLDGKFFYSTTFSSQNKQDSKKRGLFVSDVLEIYFDKNNPILVEQMNNNDIWIERHFNVEYYGFIFHWTQEEKNIRKLRFAEKNFNLNNYCCKIKNAGKFINELQGFPADGITVLKNSKVEYVLFDCQNDTAIGSIIFKIEK
jgi:hypothetical protein